MFAQTIVSWVGSQANIFEKQKVQEIAALIRDTERHGKAQITNIQEGEETPEMLKVRKCITPNKPEYSTRGIKISKVHLLKAISSNSFCKYVSG